MSCTISKRFDGANANGKIVTCPEGLTIRKRGLFRRAKSCDDFSLGSNNGQTSSSRRKCRRRQRRTKSANDGRSESDSDECPLSSSDQSSRWESQPHRKNKSDKAPRCFCGRQLAIPASQGGVSGCNGRHHSVDIYQSTTTSQALPKLCRWGSDESIGQDKLPKARPQRTLSPIRGSSKRKVGGIPKLPSRQTSFEMARAG